MSIREQEQEPIGMMLTFFKEDLPLQHLRYRRL
jgi:hypothetical protein